MKFRFEGKDVFSAIVVICATLLLILGYNHVLPYCLLGVVAGYYGIDLTPWIKLGRNKKPKEDK